MEENLEEIIRDYFDSKELLDKQKKYVDEENTTIKDMLKELDVDEVVTRDGLVAKLITRKTENFIEDKLIEKLKSLGVVRPIKMVEVIDYSELEDVIYNGLLNASEIADCRNVKETLSLQVKKIKK